MNDIKVDSLIQKLEKYRIRLSKSKKKSKKFLVEVGVLTAKGNLKNHFKHLCIPQEQA
jgi:hypothetical protein